MTLSDHHLKILREESGISDKIIKARGYYTVTDKQELIQLGFSTKQARPPGLLLPLWLADGRNGLSIFKPDSPRVYDNKQKKKLPDGTYHQKVIKYEFPKNEKMILDVPPICQPMLGDPSIDLWITEGTKKADSGASRGLCIVALLGVWNWRGRNDVDGLTALADWHHIALNGRNVNIVFDSDVMKKPEVRKALAAFKSWLQWKKATVGVVYLPPLDSGKTGLDDYFVAGYGVDDLKGLVEAPRPIPKPATPSVELLDNAPLAIKRPLSLLDGKAYTATWLYVKITRTEGLDKDGNIIKFDPPKVEDDRKLFVVDTDGLVYGLDGDAELDDLGMSIKLLQVPPNDKMMSAKAVKSYRKGIRPDPADIFNRVVDTVDRFIDFDRSLADQRTMGEMIGCYILATWFLDAFNVIGFLWPNGDRGSGKTQLLTIIAELSYLGQVILAGGSFAALRDMADYGACLAFDDAENLSDPRRTDPDKRALLLAGNRRGNTVPLKEPGPDKTWIIRYVNTFCPRLFSAIQLPDEILASRTIIVPLIRTPDRYRANADPLDYKLWPYDRRKLIDDLWALALAHLPELPAYETRVNDDATLTGRNLEPWRAVLAVAKWLDDRGVDGLWDKIEKLSQDYQTERPDLETSDLTALVIRALCKLYTRDISDSTDISDIHIESKEKTFKTAIITDMTVEIAKEMEADIDVDDITSRRVGRQLGKMRFKKDREAGTGARQWVIPLNDLERWTLSYAIPFVSPRDEVTLSVNVTNGNNVTDVTDLLQMDEDGEPIPVQGVGDEIAF